MEVLCERCHAEYDFDEALATKRGTTVKCAACGHQFRVFLPRLPEDRATRQAARRAAKLFDSAPADLPNHDRYLEREAGRVSAPRAIEMSEDRGKDFGLERSLEAASLSELEQQFMRDSFVAIEEIGVQTDIAANLGQPKATGGDMETSETKIRATTPTPSYISSEYDVRGDTFTDPRFISAAPPRRSAAIRWVLAVIVLGGLALLGTTLGRDFLARSTGHTAYTPDPRTADLLDTGNRQLGEGDIEAAQASFDKAHAFSNNDVRVLQALARLANIRSDQAWLKLRLLDPSQTDFVNRARTDLDALAQRALGACDLAFKAANQDSALSAFSTALLVDAFRLVGDLHSARSLIAKDAGPKSDGEYAYVLAALEMSESTPNWAVVIDRLRFAVAGEQYLGRARAALVYALLRCGQVDAAMTELEAFELFPKRHALLVELKQFAQRTSTTANQANQAPQGLPQPVLQAGSP